MKKQIKGLCATGIILISVVVLVIVWICFRERKWSEPAFENAEYEGVFCTMVSNPDFSEEDFLTYRGLHVVKSERKMESFKDISDMMNIVFSHNPGVGTVYLEIDPLILWEDASSKEDKWKSNMEKYMLETMRRQTGTVFEILLPYPVVTHLAEMDENKLDEYVQVYHSFVSFFDDVDNVLVSYVGAEQWLNSNRDNYDDTYKLNQDVERHIFLSVFCDRRYLTNADSIMVKLDQLRGQIAEYMEQSAEYPDYSDWSFVFMGDSIIGIDMSTKSIPGVVGTLSGASAYNCGKNGASAAFADGKTPSFLEMVDVLTSGNTEKITDADLQRNLDLFFNEGSESDKLCIFVNFGLNDYFMGYPVENPEDAYDEGTYAGALRTGITRLKEAYPQAEIVILVPTYIYTYAEGNAVQGKEGQPLNVYREAVKSVAEEMDVYCKDNYQDMLIDASNHLEYLSDECHLNENGRFLFGEQLIFFLEENVIK